MQSLSSLYMEKFEKYLKPLAVIDWDNALNSWVFEFEFVSNFSPRGDIFLLTNENLCSIITP